MNANAFLQKDYENETAFRPKKTNPNKPNFFKGQNELKIACQKIRPHPQKRKAQEKKWILFEQSYILAGNLLKNRICSMNNVQAWL